MRRSISCSLVIALIAASFALRADQDDIDNNADLQPTPEERARAAVLKRWPDATEIDAADMLGELPQDNDGQKMDDDEKGNDVADKDDDKDDDKDEDKDDGEEMAEWTVSVLFRSGGKDLEALLNDDGKIQYVYETIPTDKAPKDILDAAQAAVKEGEVIFCQKRTDESAETAVQRYVVGVGAKDVELDLDGKVLKVKDAPAGADDNDDDDGDDMKLRI